MIFIKKLIICILLFCLFLIGCKSTAEDNVTYINENNEEFVIIENTVKRDEYHGRGYDEWIIIIGNISYHIEKNYINTLNKAKELAKELHEKIELLKSMVKDCEKDISINIVKSNVKTGKILPYAYYDNELKGIYMHENQIDDIYTSKALTEVVLDIHVPWLAFGIAGKIFEHETDDDAIRLFYSNKNNINMLGLFGGRFHQKANNDVDMAINTAISFYRYLDYKYGESVWNKFTEKDIKVNTALEKQEWLYSIGCYNIYDPLYSEKIMNYPCYSNDEYDILVRSDYADFYINFYNNEDSIMKNSVVLERLLHHNFDSYTRYMELARDKGFEEYITNKRILFYIDEENSEKRTVTYTELNKVLLFGWSFEYAHAHELAHAMIEYYNNIKKETGDISVWWLNEGFATYISATLPMGNSSFSEWAEIYDADYDYEIFHRIKLNDFDGSTYPEMNNAVLFEQNLWNNYYNNKLIEDQSDFNKIRYYDSFAKAYMDTQIFNINSIDIPYEVLASFTKYIIETYSWHDLVYMISNNVSYEEALGIPFDKLILEWKKW